MELSLRPARGQYPNSGSRPSIESLRQKRVTTARSIAQSQKTRLGSTRSGSPTWADGIAAATTDKFRQIEEIPGGFLGTGCPRRPRRRLAPKDLLDMGWRQGISHVCGKRAPWGQGQGYRNRGACRPRRFLRQDGGKDGIWTAPFIPAGFDRRHGLWAPPTS